MLGRAGGKLAMASLTIDSDCMVPDDNVLRTKHWHWGIIDLQWSLFRGNNPCSLVLHNEVF